MDLVARRKPRAVGQSRGRQSAWAARRFGGALDTALAARPSAPPRRSPALSAPSRAGDAGAAEACRRSACAADRLPLPADPRGRRGARRADHRSRGFGRARRRWRPGIVLRRIRGRTSRSSMPPERPLAESKPGTAAVIAPADAVDLEFADGGPDAAPLSRRARRAPSETAAQSRRRRTLDDAGLAMRISRARAERADALAAEASVRESRLDRRRPDRSDRRDPTRLRPSAKPDAARR